jgi:nucleoid DNA-binding protein
MNSKDFFTTLSQRIGTTPKEAQKLAETMALILSEQLEEGDTFSIQGFGNFDIKKKLERIVINPTNKQRQLVPPKLVLSFKASNVLKDKLQTVSLD